jgi:MFS family permease
LKDHFLGNTSPKDISHKAAVKFVIFIGIISLCADITYEGARSITGPFLAFLGANALIVGFVAGFGELIGYSLRMLSGILADKTKKYWAITLIGYHLNLLVVPLLALSTHWEFAAGLIIIERMGKGIRTPPRDAMLSHACHQMGLGWGFGLHESLDKAGALLGPLVVAFVLWMTHNYRAAFAVLLIPALIALSILFFARYLYPHPEHLESNITNVDISKTQGKAFWIYLTGAAFIAAGFADFPLIAFHFAKMHIVSNVWIPISYAIAMGVDSVISLFLGRLYDKKGFIVLIIVTLFSSFFAPLVFFGNFSFAMLGIILWSIGVGAHESLMRAIIAKMIPIDKRASAYGIFNMAFGIAWFLGSVAMGALYDYSISYLVLFSLFIQLSSIPILFRVKNLEKV